MTIAIPRIEDLSDRNFDPYVADEAMFGDHPDPHPRIAELRAQAPILPGGYQALLSGAPAAPVDPSKPVFTVLSYAAVDQILADPEAFSNRSFLPTLGVIYGPLLSVLDPPTHTRYRALLQTAFRPQIIQTWRENVVGPVIDELIAGFDPGGRVELMGQFVRPMPFNIIFRLLGLPPEDIAVFYRLTMAELFHLASMDIGQEAADKLGRFFSASLAARRAAPSTDLISVLSQITEAGEPLPEDILTAFLRQLMSAGGETSFRTLSVLLVALLNRPDQLEAVRNDRSLVPAAVEEALRWDGPVMSSTRETTRDVVVDGVALPAGAHLEVLYGAANRDPAVFERPDEFDIFRPKRRHFGFAAGVHICIGAALARLEVTRALNALLDYAPTMRLDPDEPPPALRGTMMRAPPVLRVVFEH
jgi:cytochrome P450